MKTSPTFEATFPDGEFKGTLKIGNETISVYLKEIIEIEQNGHGFFRYLTTKKRKFVLIEE